MLAKANKRRKEMVELSNSQEEYLKTMYILANTEKEIRVTDIAKRLKITKPSVNRAIHHLADKQLINYESYGEITLTDIGKQIAQKILKKHDIVKMFLTEVLEIEDEQAEKEAKAMKHALSTKTEEKLETYIHKVLDLGDLDCGYDSNNEKCRHCVKITARNRLKKNQNTNNSLGTNQKT